MSRNRIEETSIAASVARQTPHNEFDRVLAQTMGEVAQTGIGMLGGITSMAPLASAAVSGVRALTSQASLAAGITSVGGGATAGTPAVPSVGGFAAGLGNIGSMNTDQAIHAFAAVDPNQAGLLELQRRLAQESEQFAAISNILKVKSDSAKAAINNIR